MLDTVGSRQFYLVPTDPPQGTVEPLSEAGGASVIMCFKKVKMLGRQSAMRKNK